MYKAPRGTADILPEEQPYWRFVEAHASALCEQYGYQRIDTPVFEESDLFARSVGGATDVIEKETYSFADRSGDWMTLRPEGTAAVCRAYLEHGMRVLPQPVRLYSVLVPMFRYDRPQAGRQRQFHQINVEAIGSEDASLDAEIIELAWRFFAGLGLRDLELVVNSIGDRGTRASYVEALRGHYHPQLESLCSDCKSRFRTNPLRLLDCEKPSCQPYLADAPRSVDYLTGDSRKHWDDLTGYLRTLGLDYTVDHRLVRGLDYYSRTVFEIQPPVEGAQSTLGGGGRYDGLIEQLGGRPTPGIGFACGVERVILNLKRQGVEPSRAEGLDAVVAYVGEPAKEAAVTLASKLRAAGVQAVLAPAGRSLKAQMRYAGSLAAAHVLVLGEDELAQGTVTVRDMAGGEQRQIPLDDAPAAVSRSS